MFLPRRWVGERSFAWLSRFRRLGRDYERLSTSLQQLHFVVFACIILARYAASTFIQYTIACCKGELFEGRLIVLFGLLLLAAGLALRLGGITPYALRPGPDTIPTLVVSLLSIPPGFDLSRRNAGRLAAYQQAYAENPARFVRQERQCTESFIQWYSARRCAAVGVPLNSGLSWANAVPASSSSANRLVSTLPVVVKKKRTPAEVKPKR